MTTSIFPYTFEKTPVWKQIIIALIFIPIQFYVANLSSAVLKLPLFMDMIFLYAASFIGIPCGLVFSFGVEAFTIFMSHTPWVCFVFTVCYLSGLLLVRLFMIKSSEIGVLKLVLISLISVLVISIEGGLIYSILFEQIDNGEVEALRYLTYSFLVQNIPIYISAILSRIPINFVDKIIAVFAGFFIAVGVEKIVRGIKKSTTE